PATVQLDASGTGSIAAGDVFDAVNSSDNCGTVNPQSVSPSSFTCANLGENPVTLTVNDGHGNTATCSATVTVADPNGFCSQVVCLDGEIAKLVMDVEGMGLNSSIERAITSRLELAAYKFCLWNSASTAISNLENIITYVQYQRGRYIPIGQANYIIGQIQALIDALNDGIAECCSGAARGPQPANVVEGSEALKLEVAPNPFRSETGIQFYLPDAGPASLDVFNLQGQRVRSLLAETLDAGRHARQWDGTADGGQALSAGVYLVRLRTEAGVLVKKVSLAR
ncbi:MAG: T9SS type A sorting domain-containing protein, partial [Phaeodactylibacter sp.]|nr:T9SS type A sorting domain-containing protein [Phaeodactylibacter sp.]